MLLLAGACGVDTRPTVHSRQRIKGLTPRSHLENSRETRRPHHNPEQEGRPPPPAPLEMDGHAPPETSRPDSHHLDLSCLFVRKST